MLYKARLINETVDEWDARYKGAHPRPSQRLTVTVELEGYQAPDEKARQKPRRTAEFKLLVQAGCVGVSQADAVRPARLAGN